MTIIGLDDNELYKLKKSVGVAKRGMLAEIEPIEAYLILKKALKKNKAKEISSYLKLTSPTQIYRTISIFENLIPELHKNVTYLNRKKNSKVGTIGFQQASELSKVDKKYQLATYKAIIENNFSWNDIKSLNQLLNRSGKKFDEVIETMKERKGVGENYILVFPINLNEISSNVYQSNQDKRNEIFLKIAREVFQYDIKEVHLGTSTMAITFAQKSIYFSRVELNKIKQQIIELIRSNA